MFSITTQDNTKTIFVNLERKLNDFSPELQEVGVYMTRSIDRNFEEQGRPQKWIPSKAAIARNGMTLVDTGRLRRSFSFGAEGNIFELGKTTLTIGSTVPYARTHNEGLTVNIFGRTPYKFPKREFAMIQEEDVDVIIDILQEGIDDATR